MNCAFKARRAQQPALTFTSSSGCRSASLPHSSLRAMKDGTGAGELAVSRPDLYQHYVGCYLQESPEVGPCRDPGLLSEAAQYLRSEPEPGDAFTVFPFYRAATEGCGAANTPLSKHLSAFIRAAELLETLCVNLFLQPWKKEIRTLKTFTGPFVYCLMPVFSTATIQSVLASIGYVPHADPQQREYRLSEDANAERAMLVGFELLLARVECYHFLEVQEKNQLSLQAWLEVLQRRVQPAKLQEHTEEKATAGQTEDEEKGKTKELDKKEGLYKDTRLAVTPQPKPRHAHLYSVDQSIMEMQRTYPDLAIRGRPLLPDKPLKVHSSGSKAARTADLPKRDCIDGARAAAVTTPSSNDGSETTEVFDAQSRSSGFNDRTSGGTANPRDAVSCSFNNTDRSGVDDELSGPQAISLRLTLRAGPKAEQNQKPGGPQPPAETPAWAQLKTDTENERHGTAELSSLSSMDERRELRELAERMGQLSVQETKDEAARKDKDNARKDRRKKARKSSTEGEAERQNSRKQATEKGPALSDGDGPCAGSLQCAAAVTKEQKQPAARRPSLLVDGAAEHQDCNRDRGVAQQEAGDPGSEDNGPGEEEQEAQSFVIL